MPRASADPIGQRLNFEIIRRPRESRPIASVHATDQTHYIGWTGRAARGSEPAYLVFC